MEVTQIETILWVLKREIDGTDEAMLMTRNACDPELWYRLTKRKAELLRAVAWAEEQNRRPN